MGSIPGSGSSPGEGNGNLHQYFCLENPMDRGAWQVPAHGIPRVGHDLVLSFILSVFIRFTISATHIVSATTYLDASV